MEKRIVFEEGFLLGKFLPPHAGHVHLIESARAQCRQVWVLVCSIEREPIPGYLRYEWVKKLFPYPDVHVVHVTDEVPQAPEEHPDFWAIWLEIFRKYGPPKPDAVFSSEEYGEEIARRMNIKHVLVDIERKTFPVSGTKVRTDPMKYWDFIPAPVRPYFLKRVVLTGPESTGKSTLAEKLAKHYRTAWAEEYAREFWPSLQGRKLELKDVSVIAGGQLHNEDSAAEKADKLLLCDTDLITTQTWSYLYFKECTEWIIRENHQRKYDLWLLMSPDIAWVDDGQRESAHLRQFHFNLLKEELDRRKLPYVIISGSFEERFHKAVKAIDSLLKSL